MPPEAGEVFAKVLAGEFDADAEAPAETEAAASKRVLAAEPDAPKLHKVLAQAGIGSRRDMEHLIVEGRITVNGEPAHIGQRISFGDQIKVDGKPVRVRIVPPPARVLAYHKPVGEVVTHDDPAAPADRVPPPAAPARRASGSRSAGSTSTPKACCCSPTRANWPTS